MERVFQCPQCEKGFKELRTLRLHLKIHNAEYPERCLVCQKVFRTKWQLKQHQMDHGGERPYPCPECSFTCKTKQQLNEHRRKHSGEKAYCCALCGTRFTYRNGLIKHTKLNRCPKKIITADGETIIKKRSRVVSKQNNSNAQKTGAVSSTSSTSSSSSSVIANPPSLTVTPVLNLQMSVAVAEAVNNVISATKGNKDALDKKIMEVLRRNNSATMSSSPPSNNVQSTVANSRGNHSPERILSDPLPSPLNRTSPIIDTQMQMEDIIQSNTENQIQDTREYREAGESFNLALLDDSSNCLVSTTCTLPTQTITTKAHPSSASSMTTTSTSSTVIAHNGVLPPNTINELSAATGLPSSEICSWAATLPTGALVKVTHHYNTSIEPAPTTAQQDQCQQQQQQLLLPTIINIPQHHNQVLEDVPPTSSTIPEVTGALKNSSVGLLSYQEIFAVDPNEVLQKSQSKSSLLASRACDIKVEPPPPEEPSTSINSSLEDFIDFDYGLFGGASSASSSSTSSAESSKFPLIKEEPLSPMGSDSGLSNHSSFYSYYINNNNTNEDTLADIDLGLSDCLSSSSAPNAALDDTLNILNDHDFNSMKTIVEQTFKDGREIMDVISAV